MKKISCILLMLALLATHAAALAEDYVSVAELYEQAQAMGGVWQQTFETPNGEVTIDAPIIVPDIEEMPVITVEGAKISEEMYEHITQGKKVGDADQIWYEVDWNGDPTGIFLGYENDYVDGKKTNITGYAAVDMLDMMHGDYISLGLMDRAEPTTYHFPWQLDGDVAILRGSDLTLDDAMRLWSEDIAMMFPGEEFVIQPKAVIARGSTLRETSESGKAYKRDGYFKLTMEQVIGGVPLFGGIIYDFGSSNYALRFTSTTKTNRAIEKLNVYGKGVTSVIDYSYARTEGRFSNEESYRTMTSLARVRSVEYADVPLASLDSVLANVEEEINAGNIRELYSVRLGYVLYSNPEMADHAWAIPRWIVDALYITKSEEKNWAREKEADAKWGYEFAPWEQSYEQELLVDAQTGEFIFFTIGDEETFSVPDIITWEQQ